MDGEIEGSSKLLISPDMLIQQSGDEKADENNARISADITMLYR